MVLWVETRSAGVQLTAWLTPAAIRRVDDEDERQPDEGHAGERAARDGER